MFHISNEKEKLQFDEVKKLLKQTYWANGRSDDLIRRSIENAQCYGAYLRDSGRQIGFARVITDFVSVFYISDVIVDEAYRGHGVGKALIRSIVEDERFHNIRGLLVTADAHGLYEQFGFTKATDKYMGKEPNH